MLKKKIIIQKKARKTEQVETEYITAIRDSTQARKEHNQELEVSLIMHRKNKILYQNL